MSDIYFGIRSRCRKNNVISRTARNAAALNTQANDFLRILSSLLLELIIDELALVESDSVGAEDYDR